MRQTLRVIYFNLSLLCLLLVGMEVVGQVVFLAWKGYPVYAADRRDPTPYARLFERHPYLVARLRNGAEARQGDKVITTTGMHTRWTGATAGNPNAVRVALIGGSTTFGSGVTDADSWPARLQEMLGAGYTVTNYGVPGYSTAEAIVQMALVVPESRPDIVVFYEGWNDIRNYHQPDLGSDYYAHGMQQYSNLQLELAPRSSSFMAKLMEVSATARLAGVAARRMFARRAAARDSVDHTGALYTTPDTLVDRIYLRNLSTLKLLAGQVGAYTIFIPQVLDSVRFVGGTASHQWTPRIRDSAMPELLHHLNATLSQVCAPHEAGCEVLGEMTAQRWDSSDFLDEGHFLRSGNDKFARLLAARIVALRTVKRPARH